VGHPRHDEGWSLRVEKVKLRDFALSAEDRLPVKPLLMEFRKIDLELQDLSNQKEGRGHLLLDCEIKEKGLVKLNGSIGVNPLFADLNVDLKGLGLPLAQRYIPSGVKVGLTSGKLSAKGDFLLKEKTSREGWKLDFKGDALLSEYRNNPYESLCPKIPWV
jgi:hypothetical protein